MLHKSIMCQLVFALCLLIPVSSKANNIDTVKNSKLSIDKTITVGNAFDSYKYFSATHWEETKDERGRSLILFIGMFKPKLAIEMSYSNNKSRKDELLAKFDADPEIPRKAKIYVLFALTGEREEPFVVTHAAFETIEPANRHNLFSEGRDMAVKEVIFDIYKNDPLRNVLARYLNYIDGVSRKGLPKTTMGKQISFIGTVEPATAVQDTNNITLDDGNSFDFSTQGDVADKIYDICGGGNRCKFYVTVDENNCITAISKIEKIK